MYPDLKFSIPQNRPFFFTNFVSTIDGKVKVFDEQNRYWPIGSEKDYQTLLELRAHADVLIHGSGTAKGHRTVDTLAREDFKDMRQKLKKEKDLLYVVMTDHPDEKLQEQLKNSNSIQTRIMGSDVRQLSNQLHEEGHKIILMEGGPNLLGSFFKEMLIDEVFLTIAPKIFGNQKDKTLTMVEGFLFEPNKAPNLELISMKQIDNELYLRYSVVRRL